MAISFWKSIIWTLTKDPYWVGPGHEIYYFHWRKTYIATTDCGFTVKYTIICDVAKIDHEQFRDARMREEENQQQLVADWHSQVFQPKFKELRCSFKYLLPWNEIDYGNPFLCWNVKEGDEDSIFWDTNCFELNSELEKLAPLKKNGCRVASFAIVLESADTLIKNSPVIKENYNMIKVRGLETPENTEAFRKWEETAVISMLHRQLKLEEEFQHIQASQEHKSKLISIGMRMVGSVVELSWEDGNWQQMNYVLRGYRKEEGFTATSADLSANGMCVVETQNGQGRAIQSLKEGKEYFYTFLLTREEPVYAEQAFPQSLFSTAAVKGVQTKIFDTLRFSIRVPTRMEMARVEQMAEKVKSPTPDPKREKINRAFEELSSFVEFDESLTQWEQNFIKQIELKKYSPKEKRDKIDKLRSVVESLRVSSMP